MVLFNINFNHFLCGNIFVGFFEYFTSNLFSSRNHMAQDYSTGMKIIWWIYAWYFIWRLWPLFIRQLRFWPSPLHWHLLTFRVIIWYEDTIEKRPPLIYRMIFIPESYLSKVYGLIEHKHGTFLVLCTEPDERSVLIKIIPHATDLVFRGTRRCAAKLFVVIGWAPSIPRSFMSFKNKCSRQISSFTRLSTHYQCLRRTPSCMQNFLTFWEKEICCKMAIKTTVKDV